MVNKETIYQRKNCQIKRIDCPKTHYYQLRKSEDKPWLDCHGVTTFSGFPDKPQLQTWYAKEAIKHLVNRPEDELHRLLENLKNEDFRGKFVFAAVKAPDRERDRAADIGKQLHSAIEKFCLARTSDINFDELAPEALACYNQFLHWAQEWEYEPKRVEEPVASIGGFYVGTPDGDGRIKDGRKVMLDHKSGSGIWPSAIGQAGGYWRAFEESYEECLDAFIILHFDKKDWRMAEPEVYDAKQMKLAVRYFNSLLPAYDLHKQVEVDLKDRYKARNKLNLKE